MAKQNTPKAMRKPKPKRTFKKGVKLSFYAFLLLMILGASGYVSYDYLRLETVRIVGNETVDSTELIALSGLKRGMSMLQIDEAKVRDAFSQHPKIMVDHVSLQYPHTIQVQVTERQNVALIAHLNSFIAIDKFGVILQMWDKPPQESLLAITGLSVSGYTVGEELGLHDDFQFSVLLNVLNTLIASPQAKLFTSIDLKNPVDIQLITHNDIAVRVGTDENLPKKLENAALVLERLDAMVGGVLNVIDLKAAVYSPPIPKEGASDPQDGQADATASDPTAQNETQIQNAENTQEALQGQNAQEDPP